MSFLPFILSNRITEADVDVLGCTDPLSANYNPLATVDDGSCINGSFTFPITFPINFT